MAMRGQLCRFLQPGCLKSISLVFDKAATEKHISPLINKNLHNVKPAMDHITITSVSNRRRLFFFLLVLLLPFYLVAQAGQVIKAAKLFDTGKALQDTAVESLPDTMEMPDNSKLYSAAEFAALDVNDFVAVMKMIKKDSLDGKIKMTEIKEGLNFKNKFGIKADKVLTVVGFPPHKLFTGTIILFFYAYTTDPKPSFIYYGHMINGVAEGYGICNNGGSEYLINSGFWKNGEWLQRREAIDLVNATAVGFDYKGLFEYENVKDIWSEIVWAEYPRDFYNRSLTNGYRIIADVTWTANGVAHKMHVTLKQVDFYKTMKINLDFIDSLTNHNFQKNRPKGPSFLDQLASNLYRSLVVHNDLAGPGNITSSSLLGLLKDLELQDFSNKVIKNDNPDIKAYKNAYLDIIKRCLQTPSSQFDGRDSLAGIWYDEHKDLLIYIGSSASSVVYTLTMNYNNLMHYIAPFDGFADRETYRLSNQGWKLDRSYLGKDILGQVRIIAEKKDFSIQSIGAEKIIFTNGSEWIRLNQFQ